MDTIHPIEKESYQIIESRLDLSIYDDGQRAVVARIIHATGDISFGDGIAFSPNAITEALSVLQTMPHVIADCQMVRSGITKYNTECFLDKVKASSNGFPTRSAKAIEYGVNLYGDGCVIVIGNAPTALFKTLDLIDKGFKPGLVLGFPVGFVGASESKDKLMECNNIPYITNSGERGGSPVAAACFNALLKLGDKK
ncbi:MAG: precorrin-8X methylmutase [Acidimicrobiales bacterium]|nr:precorrin-8X methylmutase [Acidimicrobiales bacterium]